MGAGKTFHLKPCWKYIFSWHLVCWNLNISQNYPSWHTQNHSFPTSFILSDDSLTSQLWKPTWLSFSLHPLLLGGYDSGNPFPKNYLSGPMSTTLVEGSSPHAWDTALVHAFIPNMSLQASPSHRQGPRISLLKYCSRVTPILRTDNDHRLVISFKSKCLSPK